MELAQDRVQWPTSVLALLTLGLCYQGASYLVRWTLEK